MRWIIDIIEYSKKYEIHRLIRGKQYFKDLVPRIIVLYPSGGLLCLFCTTLFLQVCSCLYSYQFVPFHILVLYTSHVGIVAFGVIDQFFGNRGFKNKNSSTMCQGNECYLERIILLEMVNFMIFKFNCGAEFVSYFLNTQSKGIVTVYFFKRIGHWCWGFRELYRDWKSIQHCESNFQILLWWYTNYSVNFNNFITSYSTKGSNS